MTDGIATPTTTRNTGGTVRGSHGRSIGYGEFGDPEGTPVVLCHGFGDSRLTRYPDDDLTARLGVRLITMDRPGIGLTDPMKELTILDRTDDIIDLTNSLGLNKFAVLGWSGGAPYALAAAGCMPGSVTRVGIAGGFGPFERQGFKRLVPRELRRIMTILKVAPWMSTVMANESSKQLKNGSGGGMSDGLMSGSDASILNGAGVRDNVTAGAEEAFRQGPAGVAADMLLLFRFKWGFNPEDVQRPVELWYGDDDRVTPVDVGRGLASVIPDSRLRVKPGAGHLLYLMYWEEILRTLIEEPAARTVAPGPMPEPAPAPAVSSEPAPFTPFAVEPFTPYTSEPAASATAPETAPETAPVEAEAVPVAEPAPSWWETRQQVAAEPEPSVETVAVEPEPEPDPAPIPAVAQPQPEPWRPAARAAAPAVDELERLRAAGFLVVEPEAAEPEPEATVAEPEAAVAEPEATAAEPEAEIEVQEPAAAAAVVSEPQAEETTEAEPVAATPAEEPAAEAAASEPEAVAVEPEVEARASVEAEAEPLIAEPEAVVDEAVAEPEAVVDAAVAEPEAVVDAAVAEPEVVAEPETAVEAVAEIVDVEPEAADEAPAAEVAADEPAADAAAGAVSEEERLRALGFGTYQPEPDVEYEPPAAVATQSDADVSEQAATVAPESWTAEPQPVEDSQPEAEPEPEPEPEPERELEPVAQASEPELDPAERLVAAGFGILERPEAESAAPELAPASTRTPSSGDSTLDRLRAAGFLIGDPEPELEADAQPIR